MEKLYFKTLVLLFSGIFCFMAAFPQSSATTQYAEVYPTSPAITDSVVVAFVYVSGDGCPDYFLAQDSVVGNKVYVSKKVVPRGGGMVCIQVVTKFRSTLNLGTFSQNTDIYFDGTYLKTIYPACVMDRAGVVVELTATSSIVKENSTAEFFEIHDTLLPVGTLVQFKGTKIQCFAAPCYNIVDCYAVVETPACKLDKDGIVVEGMEDCSGKLLIEDTRVMTIFPQRYVIGVPDSGLKAGDRVRFSGYKTPVDSSTVKLCYTVGVATCYEKIDTVNCVPNKKGVAMDCGGQLFVLEYSPISSARQLYYIKNALPGLKAGDKVAFGGYYIKPVLLEPYSCQAVGVATCYEVINDSNCVLDKVGEVIQGIDGCTGQLLVREISTEATYPRLYKLEDVSDLKAGDRVQFGSAEISNDSIVTLCPVAGKVVCFSKISAPATYSLSGKAMAGSEVMKSGAAILFNKNYRKALASFTITDGSFTFTGLPQAEYTVYIIPDITQCKGYLPTFYINKVSFRNSDYLTLNDNIQYLTIELRSYRTPVGTGKIHGNIFYENLALKDTVMVENGLMKTGASVAPNFAINIPVLLLNAANEAVAWTLTDVYGNYTFENIAFDTYRVVSETGVAVGELSVSLNSINPTAYADLMLKSATESTGISNPAINVLNVYPNPVSAELSVVLKESQAIGIYNVLGQLLLQKELNAGVNILDVGALNKGLLLLKAGNETIRIVKK
ncbi:MAG TPA: T9SS type A sorting domain-containing protein [Paludibacter sp.]|nr:T9SS type A sorting domain-containing protein [Paludibacter sp.]